MRMAGIIRIIVIIFLAVSACAIIFTLLLMSVRTGIEAVGVNKEICVDLRYGIIRIPIWPARKGKKEQKPKPEKPEKPKKPKKPAKYRRTLNREELDIGELLNLAFTILGELGGILNISRLRVRVMIGTNDAAKTGLLLGYVSAFTGMAVPFFENTFEMRDYHINVDADFDASHTEWAFNIFFSVRPIRMVFVMLRHSIELFGLYKKLIKKVEAEANE